MPYLKSMTEPERKIWFDEESHTYTDKETGETLISATTFIKKYKEDFDSEKVANQCSTKYGWGVSPKDILKLWNENGTVTSMLGDAVHQALEFWERFRKMGQIIMDSSGRKLNPALPKHPVIRDIILGFIEQDPYKDEDWTVYPEAFVSYGKYCGLIDRPLINREHKKARVGDYKINVEADKLGKQKYLGPFKDMPTNKLSGYELQMSFYAAIIATKDIEVEGLDAYVYTDKWRHYPMEVNKTLARMIYPDY